MGTLADAADAGTVASVRGAWWSRDSTKSPGSRWVRRRRREVQLLNPLSADDAWLRRRLLPGLVRLVEGNWANHVEDVRLFEIGTASAADGPGRAPAEEQPGGRAC